MAYMQSSNTEVMIRVVVKVRYKLVAIALSCSWDGELFHVTSR